MATLKIPINKSKSNDPGYRYMMRRISTISLDNGLTKFTNLDQVSFDIKRPKNIILKWFGLKKSAKIVESEDSIKTTIDNTEALEILYEFINEFVSCKNCGDPQLNHEIDYSGKDNILKFKCIACGNYSYPSIENKCCEKVAKTYTSLKKDELDKYIIEVGVSSSIDGNEDEDNDSNGSYDDDLEF